VSITHTQEAAESNLDGLRRFCSPSPGSVIQFFVVDSPFSCARDNPVSKNPFDPVEHGTRTDTDVAAPTRRVPPYNVILANDEDHSYHFVIEVLNRTLGYSVMKAKQLVEMAHTSGRAVVWTGPREVAELKLEQITSCHETLDDGTKLGPLHCSIEPAPGT